MIVEKLKKQYKWLDQVQYDIIFDLSVKYKISTLKLLEDFNDLFKNLNKELRSETINKILLHGFGKFELNLQAAKHRKHNALSEEDIKFINKNLNIHYETRDKRLKKKSL